MIPHNLNRCVVVTGNSDATPFCNHLGKTRFPFLNVIMRTIYSVDESQSSNTDIVPL